MDKVNISRRPRLRWWERLNKTLFPYMGPAQITEYGAPSAPAGGMACPVCGEPMSLHVFERGDAHTPTRMFCPVVRAAYFEYSGMAPFDDEARISH